MVRNSFEVLTYEPGKGDGWDEAYARLRQMMGV